MNAKITETQIVIVLVACMVVFFFSLHKVGIIFACIMSLIVSGGLLYMISRKVKAQRDLWFLNRKRPVFVVGRHPKNGANPDCGNLFEEYKDDIVVVSHNKVDQKKGEIITDLILAGNKNNVEVVKIFFRKADDKISAMEEWERIEGKANYPDRIEAIFKEVMGSWKATAYKKKPGKYEELEEGIEQYDFTWNV